MKKLLSLLLIVSCLLILVGCFHQHNFKEADCLNPKTCSECSETEGVALGHQWNDATCITPKTCITCGKTEGSALGHSWESATCASPKTCMLCGSKEGKKGTHDVVNGKCSVCNLDYYEELVSLIIQYGKYYNSEYEKCYKYGTKYAKYDLAVCTDKEYCWFECIDNDEDDYVIRYQVNIEKIDVKRQEYNWSYLFYEMSSFSDMLSGTMNDDGGKLSGKLYATDFSKSTATLKYDNSSFKNTSASAKHAGTAANMMELLIVHVFSDLLEKSEHNINPLHFGFEYFE